MYVSRDVKFVENQGYYDKKDWDYLKNISHSTSDRAASLRFFLDHLGNGPSQVKGNADQVPRESEALHSTTNEEPIIVEPQYHVPKEWGRH